MTTGDGLDELDRILPRRVDDVRGTELAGQLELAVVEIDGERLAIQQGQRRPTLKLDDDGRFAASKPQRR